MRRITIPLLALLLAAAPACAQDLAAFLPGDTLLALGISRLNANQDKLQGFLDKYEELGVGEALEALMQEGEDELPEDATGALDGIQQDLKGLSVFDLVGQDAVVALSASPFDPVPSLLFLSRLSHAAAGRFDKVVADLAASADTHMQTLQESGTTFYVLPQSDTSSPLQAVAFAKAGNLLVVASKPDALRGVLRLRNGSQEPSFVSGEGYRQVFGPLGSGNFRYYVDYAQIAKVAQPFTQGIGLDPLVKRLVSAFATAGRVGGVLRLTDAGYESESFQAVDAQGGDEALYTLLTAPARADLGTTAFVPADALAYSSSTVDLSGWWGYLNKLSTTVPQLGSDLNSLVRSFVGVDLQAVLFDWAGSHVSTVTVNAAAPAKPGMPAENLLGDFVYLIEAVDEEAAAQGLQTLFENVGRQLAAMSSATGGAPADIASESEVAGVTVHSYDISAGLQLSYALADGYALIATSPAAMRAVLQAQAAPGSKVRDLVEELPGDATSVTYTDSRAVLRSSARQLGSQIQLMAGLSGASNLDFDAVSRASNAVEEFLRYVAGRAGISLGYGTRGAEGIYGHSSTKVNW
ncbi:MAG TPA: DUF3352 domain-containing protein [Trueperaceae bacterium]